MGWRVMELQLANQAPGFGRLKDLVQGVQALVEAVTADVENSLATVEVTTDSKDRAMQLQRVIEEAIARPEMAHDLLQQVVAAAATDRALQAKLTDQMVQSGILKQIDLHAGGLDIGAEEIWAAVPEGRDEQTVSKFGAFTTDLYALADWLQQCGLKTVAMESTGGVYWISIYDILESRGVQVFLVNARHVKNVSGRKTDVLDCQWLQHLHSYGLLRALFRPEEEMSALRAYVRHQDSLIRYRAAHIQHMQKALQQMKVQLTQVLRDITSTTGLTIIRSIVEVEYSARTRARPSTWPCRARPG